jgi:sec-independent protein translocase protein TatC
MNEGDPDDERDDERRHDSETPEDETPGDEKTPADEDETPTEEDTQADEESSVSDDERTDGPTGEDPDESETAEESDTPERTHPGPWPDETPEEAEDRHPGESFMTDDSDAAEGDEDPSGEEPPMGPERPPAARGEDGPPAASDEERPAADEEDGPPAESEDVTITGGAAAPTPEEPEPVGPAGAPDDQEMPLTQHIEEMIRRLLVVIVVMALVSAVVFPFADRLINFLWYSFLPGQPTDCVQQVASAANATNGSAINATNGSAVSSDAACPRLYNPLSLVLARLKVASLSGFIIALPVFVYETYLFMRPGLYPNERRYYLASVPTSLVLAGIGVLFAYFLVLPLIFTYFLGYSQPVAQVAFGLSETFGLILLMLGMFAAIFQIPLFLMLAIMMGVTTRRWLEQRRLYFWFGFAGIAFLFSPDPTGMAPFIVALTMIVLFEGTLLLLRWTGR